MDKTKQARGVSAIVDNDDGSKTIPLRKPLDVAGAKVSALRMREPLVEDTLASQAFSGNDAQREVFAMANLCGLAPMDLHKLPMKEYKLLQAAYMAFHD